MLQLGTQFPEETLNPPRHVWQVMFVAQARQLLILQLGAQALLSAVSAYRLTQELHVVEPAQTAQ
jgi:hypothetical protein